VRTARVASSGGLRGHGTEALCGLGGGPLASFIPIIQSRLRAAPQNGSANLPKARKKSRNIFAFLHMKDLVLACACRTARKCLERGSRAVPKLPARRGCAILRRPIADPAATDLPIRSFADYTECQVARPAAVAVFSLFSRAKFTENVAARGAWRGGTSIPFGRKRNSIRWTKRRGRRKTPPPELSAAEIPSDPHRETYLQNFARRWTLALASLDARDRDRLRLYYRKIIRSPRLAARSCEH